MMLLLALGCACAGQQRLERVQRLTDDGKALFSRYKQFMTEGQQDEFLACESFEQQKAWVAGLHVEERLAKYPEYIRTAIWSQDVVPGMDRAAVLLSWSTPELREFSEEQLARGNEVERWNYQRDGGWVQVVIANGVVTAVQRAKTGQ